MIVKCSDLPDLSNEYMYMYMCICTCTCMNRVSSAAENAVNVDTIIS